MLARNKRLFKLTNQISSYAYTERPIHRVPKLGDSHWMPLWMQAMQKLLRSETHYITITIQNLTVCWLCGHTVMVLDQSDSKPIKSMGVCSWSVLLSCAF